MLFKTDDLDYTDIGILHNADDIVHDAVNKLRTKGYDTDKITTCECRDSSSSEWPAVIVVLKLVGYDDHENLSLLYTAISRTRVKCSVLLINDESTYYEDSTDSEDNADFADRADYDFSRLIEELKPIARVIKHYPI